MNESPRKDYQLVRNCRWIGGQYGELSEARAMNCWWHSLARFVVSLQSHFRRSGADLKQAVSWSQPGLGHSKAKMVPDENDGGASQQASWESSMPSLLSLPSKWQDYWRVRLPPVLYSLTKSYFLMTNVWRISRNRMWQIIWNNIGLTIIFAILLLFQISASLCGPK